MDIPVGQHLTQSRRHTFTKVWMKFKSRPLCSVLAKVIKITHYVYVAFLYSIWVFLYMEECKADDPLRECYAVS